MRTVHKFTLPITDRSVIGMPRGAKVLAIEPAAESDHDLLVWALVDTSQSPEGHEFIIRGTGQPLPLFEPITHVATVQAPPFVWHVFCRPVVLANNR